MWKRKDLKSKAKDVLKKNYWSAIVACFILALFTGDFGTSIMGIWQNNDSNGPNYRANNNNVIELSIGDRADTIFSEDFYNKLNADEKKVFNSINTGLNSTFKSQKFAFKIWDSVQLFNESYINYGILLSTGALLALLLIIFIAEPLAVGGRKYFLKIREEEDVKISVILDVFRKKGDWLNITKIMLFRNIFNWLWYLTIIGGIIKTYEYGMIPYILAENPEIQMKEAFKLSKNMMKNNKWKAFVLDISFIGWEILSAFTLGLLNVFFINAYSASTRAELYVSLKDENKEKAE